MPYLPNFLLVFETCCRMAGFAGLAIGTAWIDSGKPIPGIITAASAGLAWQLANEIYAARIDLDLY